jgi:hypothetical protein
LLCSPPRHDPLLPSSPRRFACRRDHLVGLGCGEMSTPRAWRNNTSTPASIGAEATTPSQQTLGRGVGAAAAAGLKRGGQSTAPPRPLARPVGLPPPARSLGRSGRPAVSSIIDGGGIPIPPSPDAPHSSTPLFDVPGSDFSSPSSW